MRKTSNILLLIGMILGFVGAGLLLLFSIGFFIFGSPIGVDLLMKSIEAGESQPTAEEIEAIKIIWIASMISSGVIMIIIALFSCASAGLALLARSNPNKRNYILALVFSVLGGNEVAVAGSIVGIISCKNDKKVEIIEAKEE